MMNKNEHIYTFTVGNTRWIVEIFSELSLQNIFSMGLMMDINFSNSLISWMENVMPHFISIVRW